MSVVPWLVNSFEAGGLLFAQGKAVLGSRIASLDTASIVGGVVWSVWMGRTRITKGNVWGVFPHVFDTYVSNGNPALLLIAGEGLARKAKAMHKYGTDIRPCCLCSCLHVC